MTDDLRFTIPREDAIAVKAAWDNLTKTWQESRPALKRFATQLQEELPKLAKLFPVVLLDIAVKEIEKEEYKYNITGNPLHAWNVYMVCRALSLPVPDWVYQYLDRSAEHLMGIAQRSRSGEKLRDPSSRIAEAMEMKAPGKSGTGTVFSNFEDFSWLGPVMLVRQKLEEGCQVTYAIEAASKEMGIPKGTVWRYWRRAIAIEPELSQVTSTK